MIALGGSGRGKHEGAPPPGKYKSCTIVGPGVVQAVEFPEPMTPDDAWEIVTEAANSLMVLTWRTREWK